MFDSSRFGVRHVFCAAFLDGPSDSNAYRDADVPPRVLELETLLLAVVEISGHCHTQIDVD